MTAKPNLEIRVGLFVLLGVVVLTVFIFSIGDYYFYKPGYRLRVAFKSANGIVKGAPVQYAGVTVGKVEDIRILYEGVPPQPRVELVVWLPQHVRVQEDDLGRISTFGLLGEKYLDVLPTYGKGRVLTEGDALIGMASVSTEEITQQASNVLKQLAATLETVNTFFYDTEVRASLKGTLSNAQAMTEEWRVLGVKSTDLLDRLGKGEGTVGKLFYDETLYQEMLDMVRDLRAHPWKLLQKPKGGK